MSEEASYYEQKLKAIYREEDLFRLAVRGHQFVDFLLWKLVEESTPGQHGTELKQLSLVAKVDVLPSASRIATVAWRAFEKD